MSNIKLGIAPIAWTNDDMPELGSENTFEQCISEMALAGYQGSEVGNKYPKDPKVLDKYLKIRNLKICNAWFSTFFLTKPEKTIEKFHKHCKFLQAMGAEVVGISEQGNSIQGLDKAVFSEKPVYTEEEWKKVVSGFNTLAKISKEEYGIKLCVHHHMGTGIQTVEEIEKLMDLVCEDVYLLFDAGHLYLSEGTQESVDYIIEKYMKRICHIHLKDVRADVATDVKENNKSFLTGVKEGVFTIPGDGCINYDNIFEIISASKYEGWIVVEAEQDPAKNNPFEYAVEARKFIKEKMKI